MNVKRFLRGTAVSLACWGLVLPPSSADAAGPKSKNVASARKAAAPVVDVALGPNGTFQGRLVSEDNADLGGQSVVIRQGRRIVATAVTNADGEFSAKNLRGGVYQVASGRGHGVFRLWSPNTAPPAATETAVVAQSVVRGQNAYVDDSVVYYDDYFYYPGGIDLITAGTLGTAVAALVVSILMWEDIKDLEDEVQSLSNASD